MSLRSASSGNAFHGIIAGFGEGGTQEQVLRRIAGNREFRRQQKARAPRMGQPCGIDDLFRVADEVAHHKIELRDGKLERHTEGRKRLERLCHSGSGVAVGREPASLECAAGRPGRALAFHAPRIPVGTARKRQRLAESGWTPHFVTLWRGDAARGGLPVLHQGPFVRRVRVRLGLGQCLRTARPALLPQGRVAVPFTPVPGRGCWRATPGARAAGAGAAALCKQEEAVVFAPAVRRRCRHRRLRRSRADAAAHGPVPLDQWRRTYPDFDAFPREPGAGQAQEDPAGAAQGGRCGRDLSLARRAPTSPADWDFFYRCYERTYREHGNPPYLTRDFFQRMADTMPENWLLFIAERNGKPWPPASLIGIGDEPLVAYGRYWGALERVDCLHFEACYYQPLAWCIAHGAQRFEGGAQGEHKMARALMPVKTTSAHWLAHPAFADAVEKFLEREGRASRTTWSTCSERSPFRPRPRPPEPREGWRRMAAGRAMRGCYKRAQYQITEGNRCHSSDWDCTSSLHCSSLSTRCEPAARSTGSSFFSASRCSAASCTPRCRRALPSSRSPGLPSPAP
jgi:predicted N-acyltransferase